MSSSVHSEAELEGSELPTAMLLVKKPHRSLASACSTYQVLAFAGGGRDEHTLSASVSLFQVNNDKKN